MTPLVGLAKWAILGPVLSEDGKNDGQMYQKLHCIILECVTEVRDRKSLIVKTDLVPSVKLVGLIECVQDGIEKTSSEQTALECIDRLSQFLLSLQSTKLIFGKISEVVIALNKLPYFKANGHRLLKMFVQKSK